MKKIVIPILVLAIMLLSAALYKNYEHKRDTSEHIASCVYENVSELNRYIKHLKSDFSSQVSVEREYVYIEIAVNRINADLDTLSVMYPKQELRLKEIISNYAHLMEKKTYGLDSHRAIELIEMLNEYVALYSDCDIFSEKGSYSTLLLRDEYVIDQINKMGIDNYRNLNLEIVSLK